MNPTPQIQFITLTKRAWADRFLSIEMKLHWPPVLVVVIVWKRLVTTTHYTILGLAGLLAMTEKQETRPDPDFLFFPVAPVAQIHSLVLQL